MPTVRQLMRPGVREVRDDEPIAGALRSMRDAEVGLLLVVDRSGRSKGVVSKTDLLTHVADHGGLEVEVRSITSSELYTVGADEPVSAAIRKMAEEGVHHVVVVDQGEPIGVFGAWDLVRAAGEGRLVLQSGGAGVRGPRSGPGV